MGHVAEYGLSYGTEAEFDFRFNLYAQKEVALAEINADPNNTFTVGHNKFSTWTDWEYKALLGWRDLGVERDEVLLDETAAAASVDWRTKGAVTGVKDQGQCGSCWAFSTTGSIEGADFLQGNGALQSFSEQQLVSCDHLVNKGCNGGSMDAAFMWARENPLMLESAYPYTSGTTKKDGECKYKKAEGKSRVSGHTNVQADSQAQLDAAVSKQPVSVAVEADKNVFQHYKTGVLNSPLCGHKLDHGVLTVGYADNYYIVKNSWGASWGDSGYLKIGKNNICGILMQPSYPTA